MRRKTFIAIICAMNFMLIAGCRDSGKSVTETGSTGDAGQAATEAVSESGDVNVESNSQNEQSDTDSAEADDFNTSTDDQANDSSAVVDDAVEGSDGSENEQTAPDDQTSDSETNDEDLPQKAAKTREESFREILYLYKEAQDGLYSMEDVENMGLQTELVQFGWPYAVPADWVKYVYYDVDSDGNDELIITYNGSVNDIYGYDGQKVRLSYSTPYRGMAELYPEGMLLGLFSGTVSSGSATWYRYDADVADYLPVFQSISEDNNDEYYTFGFYHIDEIDHRDMVDSYRHYGDYPVWMHEWADQLNEEEYEKIVPKTDPIKLPEGERLSNVVLPDDYIPALSMAAEDQSAASSGKEEPIGENYVISAAEQKKMNIFLSNFSEAGLYEYDKENPDIGRLLRWAHLWTKLNKRSNIVYEGVEDIGTCEKNSLDNINLVTDKYLGIKITEDQTASFSEPDSVYECFVRNGSFYVPAADGESYTCLSIVDTAETLGDGRMKLNYTVYSQDLDAYFEGKDKDYTMTGKQAMNNAEYESVYKGYAIVTTDGTSYKLEYLKEK